MADPKPMPPVALDPLAGLRMARDAWATPEAATLDATLDALEGPLSRSFLLEQPNVAGMGIAAWGLSTSAPSGPDPEARARRMLGGRGPLAELLGDEEERVDPIDDPAALDRGADLLDALEQLDAASEAVARTAPLEVHERIDRLRDALRRRLAAESRLSATLRRHLDADDDRPDAAARLRLASARRQSEDTPPDEGGGAVRIPRPVPQDPYGDAIDRAVAREPAAPSPSLAELRGRIAKTAERALSAPAGSDRSRRAVEQARRLLAREVALTGGALGVDASGDGVDTIALRRALAERPGTSSRPADTDEGAVRPAAGLTEVPILSSRGPGARVIGYLAAGEGIAGVVRGDHVRVDAPGRKDRGWIARDLLNVVGADGHRARIAGPAIAGGGGRPSVEMARFAALVARHTGRRLSDVMAELERPVAVEPSSAPDAPKKAGKRRARGSAARAPKATPRAPITIEQVAVDGLGGPNAAEAAAVLNAALVALPGVLEGRLRSEPERVRRLRTEDARQGTLSVSVTVPTGGGDVSARGRVLAGEVADALIRSGAARVDTLRLGVSTVGEPDRDPGRLFERLAAGADDEVAEALADEKKGLDGSVQNRLARFFGDDFKDVMLFAGPMAGVLARSIQAEAFTHGKMVFFDPASFRPDSATGEALLAHELTHTRQEDDRGTRLKEAEALVTEVAYLNWLQPGGAPIAMDDPAIQLEAARASDVGGGLMRARRGKQTMGAESGPRLETAKLEERAEQVLEVVREKMTSGGDLEAQRVGRLSHGLFNNS